MYLTFLPGFAGGFLVSTRPRRAAAEAPGISQCRSHQQPDVALIGDDFSLPPVDNDKPVYDKYTTRQRQEKGLPTTYGKTRDYYYGDNVVYLTFDDGPNDKNTSRILDILKKENIHATFFLTGRSNKSLPDESRKIYQSGNAIGVHSYTHDYKKITTFRPRSIRTSSCRQKKKFIRFSASGPSFLAPLAVRKGTSPRTSGRLSTTSAISKSAGMP